MTDATIYASLFRNERKERENQPDFTGPGSVSPENLKALYEAAINDQAQFDDRGNIKVRVAGWKKESSGGKAYISLNLTLDKPKPDPKAMLTSMASQPTTEDDFIPF